MHDRRVGGVDTDDLDALELVVLQPLLRELDDRRALGDREAGVHVGQLDPLEAGEAAGREARDRPDHVDDAVLELLHEVGRLPAELQAGIDLDLNLAAGFLADLLGPGEKVHGLVERLRCGERVQAQRHRLGGGGAREKSAYKPG